MAAPVLANSPKMFEFARQSGRRIVEMVWEDLKPRDILTPGAFHNAAAAVLAVSGSINCIKHLQATAVESGVDVDVFKLFNDLGEKVPVLSAVSPNGTDTIEAFEAAGGAQAVMKQLESLLDHRPLTGNRSYRRRESEGGRRPRSQSHSTAHPPVFRQTAHCRASRFARARKRHREAWRARRESKNALFRTRDRVRKSARGHRRYSEGRGQAGTRVGRCAAWGRKADRPWRDRLSRVVFALDSAGLQDEVAFVCDGQLSGLCLKGLTVAEVSPESAVGGPLSLVQNGDRISIDVDAHALNLDVADSELAARRAMLGEPVLAKVDGVSVDLPAQRAAHVDRCCAGEKGLE